MDATFRAGSHSPKHKMLQTVAATMYTFNLHANVTGELVPIEIVQKVITHAPYLFANNPGRIREGMFIALRIEIK